MTNYSELKDRVAIVTGGSSGIGAAIAATLAASGAKVLVTYNQNGAGAAACVEAITKAGGTARALKADVRKKGDCLAIVAEAERFFGPVDILVNNAGSLVGRQPLPDLTEAHWHEVMDLNLTSVYLCTQAVVGSMKARGRGTVINVTSIAAHNGGGPGAGPYAASKAGLIALSKNFAKELAPAGIRVNLISPGVIDTPFHERFSSPEAMAAFVKSIPMGRVGKSEEVASVVAFLCSDGAAYLCGETIEINGGMFMR